MFDLLHSSTNQEVLESTSVIKVATLKNPDDFSLRRKPSRTTTKLMLFTVGKDEWNTKEDTEECIAHTAVCQKAPLGLSDVDQ